ncbi:MAG: tRNA (adenosine(37)-N6)-threonylcarbamoyltransferase complex dimerization subunit type 1 TsaB [Micrococcales bacterium]
MSLILAIDTTAGTSVALLQDDRVLAKVSHDSGVKHAELIGNAITEVFAATAVRPQALTAVVVGRGPALFTGLRVGIAAGLMFAEAAGCAVLGAVSHDAIALELYSTDGNLPDQPLLITTDARRGEVYWALYGGLDEAGLPVLLAGPAVGKHQDVIEALAESHGSITERTGGAGAEWVARLAERQLAAGVATTDTSALYLRAPDAVLPKPNQQFGKRVSG